MKTYETRIEKVKKQYLKKVTCDLCGKEANSDYDWDDVEWNKNETTIKIEVCHDRSCGSFDGGYGEKEVVDICPDCFDKKLVPWLKSQGAKIKTKEYDW